jgi:trypsin-like peptidase
MKRESIVRGVLVTLVVLTSRTAQTQNPVTIDRTRTEPRVAHVVVLTSPVALSSAPTTVVAPPTERLYRLHVTIAGGAAGWTLDISAGGASWIVTALDSAGGDLWGPELPTRPTQVTVRLTGATGSQAPQVSVDRVAVKDEQATPQAITPPDNSTEIGKASPQVKQWAKSVARLQFIGADNLGYYCTAFLVSPELMLTNDHCINTDAEVQSAIADFDYDTAAARPNQQRFAELVAHDPGLDYSLIRLATRSTRTPLRLADIALVENKGLIVIEHPNGLPKKFSRIDCKVTGVSLPGIGGTPTDFGHYCDTEGGSSGSPIQEFPSGAVLGLHHLGFRSGDKYLVNRGVKIGLILADIGQRVPAARAEITTP